VSKTVVAAALLRLEHDGTLRLTDKLVDRLPSHGNCKVG